jgi:two-component system KDP operon response regulator KdpE
MQPAHGRRDSKHGCGVRILVADDDAELLGLLEFSLVRAGFSVTTARDGTSALATFRQQPPDLLLLDVSMPHLDGLTVCREIRQHSTIPIIVLTARHGEDDLVAALEGGADDFLTKPFSPRVLLARIRALLRRTETEPAAVVAAGIARLDAENRTLQIADAEPLRLTQLETKIVGLLLTNAGRTIATDQVTRHLWGAASAQQRHTLKQLIYRLRQKLEIDPSDPQVLRTTAGVGYKFVAELSE